MGRFEDGMPGGVIDISPRSYSDTANLCRQGIG
jgi:hypothetical protein